MENTEQINQILSELRDIRNQLSILIVPVAQLDAMQQVRMTPEERKANNKRNRILAGQMAARRAAK